MVRLISGIVVEVGLVVLVNNKYYGRNTYDLTYQMKLWYNLPNYALHFWIVSVCCSVVCPSDGGGADGCGKLNLHRTCGVRIRK